MKFSCFNEVRNSAKITQQVVYLEIRVLLTMTSQRDSHSGDDSNLLYHIRSAEMSNVPARSARGKIKANNMADIEEEILLQANLFLLLVLKRRQRLLQNRRKPRFGIRKHSIKFLADFFPTVRLFVFVFEILTITVVNALIPRKYVKCHSC